MSVAYVKAVALIYNNESQHECSGKQISVPCGSTEVLGIEWAVPQTGGGLFTGYFPMIYPTKPTTDSVKTIHLYDTDSNNHYWIVINDSDTTDAFNSKCNNCCGATPSMDAVTIPAPIVEDGVCPTVSTSNTYRFTWGLPLNPNSLKLTIASLTFNGVPGTPYTSTGFTLPSDLLTWLNTNNSAAGTWTLESSNKVLVLTSTTTTTASIDVNLVPAVYCFTYPSSDMTVDAIKIGTNVITLPGGAITFTKTTPDVLINAIKDLLVGTYLKTTNTGNVYLQYTGELVPDRLYFGGSAVSSSTFTAGVCPS